MFELVIIISFVFMWALVESYFCKLKYDEKSFKSLPNSFDGIKIGFISDIHVDSTIDFMIFKKRVKRLINQNCNIIFLGGDYSDSQYWQERVLKYFLNFKVELGIFAVKGNHDLICGDSVIQNAKDSNINLLVNQSAIIEKDGDIINIIGSEDYYSKDYDIKKVMPKNKRYFTILLAHNPRITKDMQNLGLDNLVDITLSGHTHGGQVTLFGLYSPLAQRMLPVYSSQWIKNGDNLVLYSNGAGDWIPIRFFAVPQIHVIKLNKQ